MKDNPGQAVFKSMCLKRQIFLFCIYLVILLDKSPSEL